jgi:dihydroorotate dehydrogenase (NAD+) catalytic subunit
MKFPAWWRIDPCAPVTIGRRTLPGRIWTASGCFGYGLNAGDISSLDLKSPLDGIGAVVTKTVTPEPRAGNPMPRLVEVQGGALNSIGLENVGFAVLLEEVMPQLDAQGVPTIVSLAAARPQEFGDMAALLHQAARGLRHWHGVELNLSCPNVAEGGCDFGSHPETVAACVAAARPHLPDHILVAKLTPNAGRIAPLAAAAKASGCDAVAAINTVLGLHVDLDSGQPVLARRVGGYSGPAIRPIALAKVDEIVREVGIPVVGIGGIEDAGDALQYFALGCVAVQVGTALMRDPFAAARVAADLRQG